MNREGNVVRSFFSVLECLVVPFFPAGVRLFVFFPLSLPLRCPVLNYQLTAFSTGRFFLNVVSLCATNHVDGQDVLHNRDLPGNMIHLTAAILWPTQNQRRRLLIDIFAFFHCRHESPFLLFSEIYCFNCTVERIFPRENNPIKLFKIAKLCPFLGLHRHDSAAGVFLIYAQPSLHFSFLVHYRVIIL